MNNIQYWESVRLILSIFSVFKIMLICILTSFYPFSAFSDNQENLKALRERIQSLQKDLADREIIKQNTSDTLQEAERTISAINHRLTKLIEHDRQATEEFKQLQIQQRQIKSEIETERNQLEKLLYQQYLGGQQSYLRLILSQQDPNQIARDMHYYKQLSLARSSSIQNLQDNQYKINALAEESHQKKKEITAVQSEYFEQRKKLEQEKSRHQILLTQISGQIIQQQQEINKLENDEKRLTKLVNEINKLLVQVKSKGTLISNKLPDASTSGIPFSSLKGKLNLPVRGKLLNSFGGQRSGKQVTWKGLFIQSRNGNDVKAISEGRVVFADWLRGFGNLIIVDHGNGYMSLYGNNETLHKQVGNVIRGGDTIATVGNSGGNADSGLYFELRHRGKPFDPMTWIKIE
ncbi:murein hydrolase activator EnvC [Nitrosomonas sp. Nm166]|uniref:murein hydrolase activator EnvC family protein n=1 Tax=Nitrosomonas sp. Nm166 TaxID=1881054 RepID=UPI00210AAD9C|nr:peptidoglycan DD-metalloendopeptidase family protein [Nitrosomonas sp. Nm166]